MNKKFEFGQITNFLLIPFIKIRHSILEESSLIIDILFGKLDKNSFLLKFTNLQIYTIILITNH